MRWTAGFRTAVVDPDQQPRFGRPRVFADQTVRQTLHLAGGGPALRVRLTNLFGPAPLTVGAAAVAVRGQRAGLTSGAAAATGRGQWAGLTFGGAARHVIPAGGEAVSDPVPLAVAAGDDLVVDLYLPESTGPATYSHHPAEITRIAAGNQVHSPALSGAEQVQARYLLDGVDVLAPEGTPVTVAFGDSWFEGVGTTTGANRRSVDFLNRRLTRGWAVNRGISGNRLLRDGAGEHALARFGRDVLEVPGATHVLTHFGINDLVLPGMLGEPPVTAAALVEGFTALAGLAHGGGLRIVAATIGPFGGAAIGGPAALGVRREVNEWIRTSDVFDGVADVAAAVADPQAADRIHPALDSGDGMHLNDKGAEVLADAVDLRDLAPERS